MAINVDTKRTREVRYSRGLINADETLSVVTNGKAVDAEGKYLVFRHFNGSRDDTLFASDGGDPSQVAYSTDGMWINLFRVQPGDRITREKLADMSRHNYVTGRGGVEPNVHITPDKEWVVFTGQFAQGQRHVYAVEIGKAGR